MEAAEPGSADTQQFPETKRLKLETDGVAKTGHQELPASYAYPLMDASESAAIGVDFDDVEGRLHEVMARNGVAIVRGVLSAGDIADLEEALRQDLAELIDEDALARADPSVRVAWQEAVSPSQPPTAAWPAATLSDVGARGRFQDRGLPHGRFSWAARTNARVRRIYEVLHGTADLVSSTDNAFVANASHEEAETNKSWPHVDQNDNDTRIPCKDWDVYQGILYVWSSEARHASTTVVWPGSHREPYADYMADLALQSRFAAASIHFTPIDKMQPSAARDRLLNGWAAGARRVPVPAGGLLLFTSRTTHQGWSGGPRLAQPVCWEPRARRSALARERKLRLAAFGLPSTHWASLGQPHELSDLREPEPVEAAGSLNREEVRLPLRPSIRSRALTDGADLGELRRQLQAHKWMEPLPRDLCFLLEQSIRDEFRAIL